MSEIKESALELIGETPLLRLNRYSQEIQVKDTEILAKLEYLNPAGSVKDRVALSMIEDAEKEVLKRSEDDTTKTLYTYSFKDMGFSSLSHQFIRFCSKHW